MAPSNANPQIGDRILVDVCRSLIMTLVSEAFGDPLTDLRDEDVDQLPKLIEDRV